MQPCATLLSTVGSLTFQSANQRKYQPTSFSKILAEDIIPETNNFIIHNNNNRQMFAFFGTHVPTGNSQEATKSRLHHMQLS